MDRDKPKNFYSDPQAAQEWIDLIESDKANVREKDIYPLLREWREQHSPNQLLEIGAGQGICSDKIPLEDCHYTGIDSSKPMIDRAKARYSAKNRSFLVGDALALPFADSKFDGVFSIAVFHLIENIGEAAAEMSRVLTTPGEFLLIIPNPDAYSLWTSDYESSRLEGIRFEGTRQLSNGSHTTEVLYLHSRADLIKALEKAGLSPEEITTFRSAPEKEMRFLSIQGNKKS